MADDLTTVNKVIEAHNVIRQHVKLVGSSLSDIEAIFTLQKAGAGWSLDSIQNVTDSQGRLLQALNMLSEGLKNHFTLEEDVLPSILGENIMLALILDHKEIARLISDARTTISVSKFQEMSQEALLKNKTQINHLVDRILQNVEEHALREETVLKMVQKALQSKKA